MAAPQELLNNLGNQTIAEFPDTMDWPLIAAGFVCAGQDEYLATAVNVMKLTNHGYRAVHAEELLIEEHDVLTDQEVEVVVSEEPCRKRQGKGPACSTRIVQFAGTHTIKRVVAGVYASSRGLRLLAREGIPVVLLHGPEHADLLRTVKGREIDVPNKVAQINKEEVAEGGPEIEVVTVSSLDPLNAEGLKRFRLVQQERDNERDRILEWLVKTSQDNSVDLPAGLLTNFPRFFDAGQRKVLEEAVPSWSAGLGLGINRRKAQAFVENRIYVVFCRERAGRIEAELRASKGA